MMAKDNKIISFDSMKKRKNLQTKYQLKAEISVNLCKNGKETYINNWFSKDEEMKEDEIYLILKSIFSELSKKIHKISIKEYEYYNINFTLLYYENVNKRGDIKYICIPTEMSKEDLIRYLFIRISIYEFYMK